MKTTNFEEWVHSGKGADLWDAIAIRCGFDEKGLELQELIRHFVEEVIKLRK
jgi:hypothetical protein